MKRLLFFLTCSLIVTMTGCRNLYPVNSAPNSRDQCINLQRQQLFVNANRGNQSEWVIQRQRNQLQQEYQSNGCYEMLQKEQENKKVKQSSHSTEK